MAADAAQPGPAGGADASRPLLESQTVNKVRHDDGTKSINGFRVCQELGAGSFAKVKLCEEESSAEKFALKVFRKGRLRRQRDFINDPATGGMKVRTSLDKVYEEIAIMKRLSHPNCIRLYAIFEQEDKEGKLYLVLEYAARGATMEWDADRCTYYSPETKGLMQEELALSYVRDALQGLGYLHHLLVAHRDIKPQNLLVSAEGGCKIADFGVASVMGPDFIIVGTEGTYYFFSPEMCRSGYDGHDGRKADIWGAGVSLWAFVLGTMPFFHQDLSKLLESIGEGKWKLPDSPAASEACLALLGRLMSSDPGTRPLAPEALQDPCLRSAASAGPRATAQMS